jgi:hypothetical protein
MSMQIDHLYAIDLIDRVHKEGGYIRAFRSFCCGIPAPESKNIIATYETIKLIVVLDSDNPLGMEYLLYLCLH